MVHELNTSLLLFLDSNILPQSIQKVSAANQRLFVLAAENIIKVVMPTIVREEVRTRLMLSTKARIDDLVSITNDLKRDPLSPRLMLEECFTELARKIEFLTENLEKISEAHIREIIRALNVQLISSVPSDQVFTAYFKGRSPFSKPKERKRLPDAFIFFSLIRYVQYNHKDICVVTNDTALANALRSLSSFVVFNNIDEFLRSSQLANALENTRSEKIWIRRLPAVARWLQIFQEKVEQEISIKVPYLISNQSIIDDQKIPSYYRAINVEDFDVEQIIVHYEELTSYGPGRLGLPFESFGTASISFQIEKDDPLTRDNRLKFSNNIFESNHLYDVSARIKIGVKGTLIITVENWQRQHGTAVALRKFETEIALTPKIIGSGVNDIFLSP